MSNIIPKNVTEIAKVWEEKKINFICFYKAVKVYQPDSGIPEIQLIPISCYNLDKFAEAYEDGDLVLLSHRQIVSRAKQYARVNLGIIFEGDVNPITGNTYRGWGARDPQVNGSVYVETFPFSMASTKISIPV
jgi:hypothetical protein